MPDVDSGLLVHGPIASIKTRGRRVHLSGKRQQKMRAGHALRAEIGAAIAVDGMPAAALCKQVLFRGTGRAGLYPGLNQRTGFLLRAGSWRAAEAGTPCPADQGIGADMVDEVFDLASAVAGGILDLVADLGDRLVFP